MKKKLLVSLILIVIIPTLFSSCGTIIGGSNYNAHVLVDNKPTAKIYYNNEFKGVGDATFKVKRKDANKLSITVKEDGGQEQVFEYKSRKFRGWAFAGTVLTWTGFIGSIPVPWGIIMDLSTGSLWKPDVNEKGIIKEDYKNYNYHLELSNPTKSIQNNNENITYEDFVYAKDGTIITGVIIEQIPNVQLKIQSKDKSITTLKFEEIQKITREQVK
ncbi:MAG TPA: hypothetical protein VFS71_14030 [Flavobacterium sp.]|uniref:hypothetical protein n=1 Tax=Flavobacterium sp. TaxID=239 RepID=UPI002DB694A8|nr:hypothetical protein [Flavobacterium sp.]HEU4790800.1 hypothetical protein [Flavobacterium sp.]